jgi:hypothetical protein
MTVEETVRTRQTIGFVCRFYVRILCTAQTILIRPGVHANVSLFHSEIVSFVKKIMEVDQQINRSRNLEPGPRYFELLAYLHLIIYIVEW